MKIFIKQVVIFHSILIGGFFGGSQLLGQIKNEQPNVSFIDPFICTANDHGQTDVAAGIPFGMVKPCPDTFPLGQSGYNYMSNEVLGFSQTRFSGVGCKGVGGNIRILPFLPDDKEGIPSSEIVLKDSENATPGYYEVKFKNGIESKLTASRQVSYYQFKYPNIGYGGITVDLSSSFSNHVTEEHSISEGKILYGKVTSTGICDNGSYSLYYAFYIKKSLIDTEERGSKVIFKFNTKKDEIVNVYCSVSVVSSENAIASLKKSVDIPFVNIKNQALKSWMDYTGSINVYSSNDTLKRIFYTHLYHALQSPFVINDEDGSYRGTDGRIYQSKNPYYFGWSIWDTFRTKLPLLSFLYPEVYSEMMLSLRNLYLQGKTDWPVNNEPFLSIRTDHSIIVLLEAAKKGLLPFSLDEIYPLLLKEAESLSFESPDKVLESSYDLWALSEIAKHLGKKSDYLLYREKAFQYSKTWKMYFRDMKKNADIMHGDGLYEGTLWQYRWFVPFDIRGIETMAGGKQVFEDQLDHFFRENLFNIGNQPDIQVPYLYAYTNSPWKTQQLIHKLLKEPTENWYGTHEKWETPEVRKIFSDAPEGYISEMDDDAGTMSSFYVWSAIGLFPVFPGNTELVINTPVFEKVTINFVSKTLLIDASGLSDKNKFIQRAWFNGDELDCMFIDFNRLKKGGVLKLEMGDTPKQL